MALTFTPAPKTDEHCPDFELPGVDGKIYSKKDFFFGNPVLVMFICNHCPYVKAIEDRLIQLGHELKKQEVPVVAICANDPSENSEDSFENLQKRFYEKKYSFTYLHDSTQKAALDFGAVCTPDYFLYDSSGILRYRGRLDDSWKDPKKVTKRELFDAIQALLSGKSVPEPQTPSMGCSIKWLKDLKGNM
jgi:thiol-disulfide isomerase/thioredoxin